MTFHLDRPTTAKFPPSPSQDREPASNSVELAIAEASRRADAGDTEGAERAYLHADNVLGSDRSPRHAEVLVCLALLQRRRGAIDLATSSLDMALAMFPEHRAALSQRLAIAHESGDLATAAALRSRMLAFCESAEARAHVLLEVVDQSLEAAALALQKAIEIRPRDSELRERLRSLLVARFDLEGAVDAAVAQAEATTDAKTRARVFAQAAELCAKRGSSVDRAVALFEAAIADDPTVPGAFEAIEAVLLDASDVKGMESAYLRQIERLGAEGHSEAEARLLNKLAKLREDRLADTEGAVSSLERAIELCPRDAAPRLALARCRDKQGEFEAAFRQFEEMARLSPLDVTPYRELQRAAFGASDYDRAFFASSALIHLGAADEFEQSTYRRFASNGVPRATRPIDEPMLALLRPAEHPVRQLLLTIHDAAVATKLSSTRPSQANLSIESLERQNPATSTQAAVLCTASVVRLLGLPEFALYLRSGQAYAIAHPTSSNPALFLGDGMIGGRAVADMLFRAGYELGAQRELGRLPVFYPTTDELSTLVTAAVGLVTGRDLDPNTLALARSLDGKLDPRARTKLEQMVDAAQQHDISLDVAAMMRDVELTAGRIGLLASADLTVAARQIAIESRATPGLSTSERVRDLLAYGVSANHAEVRQRLGMGVGGPVVPKG